MTNKLFEYSKVLGEEDVRRICKNLGIEYTFVTGDSPTEKFQNLYPLLGTDFVDNGESNDQSKTIGISYSHAYQSIVNELQGFLGSKGYTVITDITDMSKTNFIITEFESALSQYDVYIVLLSDDFWKSEHCMYELCSFYNDCKQSIKEIAKRLVPLAIESVDYSEETVLGIQSYWENRKKETSNNVEVSGDIKKNELHDRLDEIEMIRYNFSDIITKLKNISIIKLDKDKLSDNYNSILLRIQEINHSSFASDLSR